MSITFSQLDSYLSSSTPTISFSLLPAFFSPSQPLSAVFPLLVQHISMSLFSSITSSAMFSFNHPLKKYIHLLTRFLLDHILCCYSSYCDKFMSFQGDQRLPCKQLTSGNANKRVAKIHTVGSNVELCYCNTSSKSTAGAVCWTLRVSFDQDSIYNLYKPSQPIKLSWSQEKRGQEKRVRPVPIAQGL